jgi:hypothetical protein
MCDVWDVFVRGVACVDACAHASVVYVGLQLLLCPSACAQRSTRAQVPTAETRLGE